MAQGTQRRLIAPAPSVVAEPQVPAKKRIKVASSKAKGREWERFVGGMIARAIGMDEADIQNSRSGKKESDIQLSGEARRRFPYHVECKNSRTAQVPGWIKQMEADLEFHRKKGTPYRSGMVVFKEHGNRTPYALIRFDHLLRLLVGKEPTNG